MEQPPPFLVHYRSCPRRSSRSSRLWFGTIRSVTLAHTARHVYLQPPKGLDQHSRVHSLLVCGSLLPKGNHMGPLPSNAHPIERPKCLVRLLCSADPCARISPKGNWTKGFVRLTRWFRFPIPCTPNDLGRGSSFHWRCRVNPERPSLFAGAHSVHGSS